MKSKTLEHENFRSNAVNKTLNLTDWINQGKLLKEMYYFYNSHYTFRRYRNKCPRYKQ